MRLRASRSPLPLRLLRAPLARQHPPLFALPLARVASRRYRIATTAEGSMIGAFLIGVIVGAFGVLLAQRRRGDE